MINPVTPWAATVQADISNSVPIFEIDLKAYKLKIHNVGGSIWLIVFWPAGPSIAFRLAFGMNSLFEKVTISEASDEILITDSTRLAYYRIILFFPESPLATFRYTTTIRTKLPLLIPFWPRDIVPLTKDGNTENTAGTIHAKQVGSRSGQLYFSMMKPKAGSVFYFQNLTAMSPYCQETEVSLRETVGGEWPELGFQFPVNADKPLPANKEYIISDAFVQFDENIPESDTEIVESYLDLLASIYLILPKPEPSQHNWLPTAEKILDNISSNKGCWTQTDGISYLNAYVGDYKTPAEIMVQLAVLLPLNEYLTWTGQSHPMLQELSDGLRYFYDKSIKSLVRWHPSLKDDLDHSEEQKSEMVMDSWYLHHPLLNLARLALRGDKMAKKLFMDSIDYAIKVARNFNYKWPVFYKMTTLEVLKAETAPGNGGEKDAPGSYAHVMLLAWQLTKEKRFLLEASRAIKKLDGLAFDIFYQANNTAFAAGAFVEMYKMTNDKHYLELSYCCLAGIFNNCQLWDCNYGYGKNFPYFFSVFPLKDAPYAAAYEELEVFAALHHYLEAAADIEILPSLRILIPEFIKYATGRLAYYYPPLLPQEMIAEETKTGEVQKDLWIPLEDIHDGWEKSGEVGQEVYGAGLPFGIITRQYFKIDNLGGTVFINYPISNVRIGKNSVTFRLEGSALLRAHMRLLGFSKDNLKKIHIEQKVKSSYQSVLALGNGFYELVGAGRVRISS
ncbi:MULTISPECIES: hypothetical protein [Sphingobacterium]|uniref:hypothetical protein n=1 Tax=Sphingobacterium TaxID=28453 RepID=UPI00257AD7D8|nr:MULTISPECIES: hypothetical protein [Sphingobacterium]